MIKRKFKPGDPVIIDNGKFYRDAYVTKRGYYISDADICGGDEFVEIEAIYGSNKNLTMTGGWYEDNLTYDHSRKNKYEEIRKMYLVLKDYEYGTLTGIGGAFSTVKDAESYIRENAVAFKNVKKFVIAKVVEEYKLVPKQKTVYELEKA